MTQVILLPAGSGMTCLTYGHMFPVDRALSDGRTNARGERHLPFVKYTIMSPSLLHHYSDGPRLVKPRGAVGRARLTSLIFKGRGCSINISPNMCGSDEFHLLDTTRM